MHDGGMDRASIIPVVMGRHFFAHARRH
jgi:hypothetical protein